MDVSLFCSVVRHAITSLTDQDVGSSVITRFAEHPLIICVGAEADDCKLSGYILYGQKHKYSLYYQKHYF